MCDKSRLLEDCAILADFSVIVGCKDDGSGVVCKVVLKGCVPLLLTHGEVKFSVPTYIRTTIPIVHPVEVER